MRSVSLEEQERLTVLSPRAGSPECRGLGAAEGEELARLQKLRMPLRSAILTISVSRSSARADTLSAVTRSARNASSTGLMP